MNLTNHYTRLYTGCILLLLSAGSSLAQHKPVTPPQLNKNNIAEVVAAMTLEEKAALVIGAGYGAPQTLLPGGTMIGNSGTKVPGTAGSTAAIARLGIPSIVLSDGPAGVRINPYRKGDSTRTYFATAFPVGTLLASSWDPALVERVGVAFGNEVKEYGIDIILAPGVNIHRNPLNGRNFEYYAEDPLLAGRMASAIINGIQANGVGTSIKHFVANNQESSRSTINTIVSERALRELYLKTFRIAIAASNPWTVMSSYNKLNGTYTAERHDLITTILRDEWKYTGFVVSDWGGGRDWVAEMQAGNDLIMPGNKAQIASLISAVGHDSLDVRILDANVARILHIVVKTPAFSGYKYSDRPDLKAHAAIAREAAAEGMVLLKNKDNTLPIQKTVKTIALFGNSSYFPIAVGTGSGEVNKAYVTSLTKGLRDAGYNPDAELEKTYVPFVKDTTAKLLAATPKGNRPGPSPELILDAGLISRKAAACDLAIITIGRNSGEGFDRKLETNYALITAEKEQIKKIADGFHAKGKKVVFVLNIAGVIDTEGWEKYADAVILAWQPGQEAGSAIADILSGKVNPSGKLPTTFPVRYADVSSAKNFPGTPSGIPEQVIYEEGIYVGYRYHDRFQVKPKYEFGYGLSYTSFSVEALKLSSMVLNGKLSMTVKVTNTGKVAGKEVVQLYVGAPVKSIDKPLQELRAFAKTQLLQPGASEVLTFELAAADLASYHSDSSSWITDAGVYAVNVGTSVQNIREKATFSIPKTLIIEKDHKILQPQVSILELGLRTKEDK